MKSIEDFLDFSGKVSGDYAEFGIYRGKTFVKLAAKAKDKEAV